MELEYFLVHIHFYSIFLKKKEFYIGNTGDALRWDLTTHVMYNVINQTIHYDNFCPNILQIYINTVVPKSQTFLISFFLSPI